MYSIDSSDTNVSSACMEMVVGQMVRKFQMSDCLFHALDCVVCTCKLIDCVYDLKVVETILDMFIYTACAWVS